MTAEAATRTEEPEVHGAAMALTLVCTGEHDVVDVLAGWTVAVLAILVATVAQPDGYRRRSGLVPSPAEENP